MKNTSFFAAAGLMFAVAVPAYPCSRVVFHGDSTNVVMVGRTLDWHSPIPTNVYVYPVGVAKESMPSGPRLQWVSQYGSVLAVSYDGGVTEGMNSEGLVVNGLFCKDAVYKEAAKGSDMPVMSLAVFVSYFLDNFATVAEVKDWLIGHEFGISGKTFDGGTASLLHWAFTDRTGATLIMEYENGKMDLYDTGDLSVLTNDPPYNDMLALRDYWDGVGGRNMLPGTVRSSDRFVRASYFINHVPKNVDADLALTELTSVIENVAVPYGYFVPGQPNLSSTQWRSIADSTAGKYYFKFTNARNEFYIDLGSALLTPGAPILKLDTSVDRNIVGCANKYMKKSKGFTPMW